MNMAFAAVTQNELYVKGLHLKVICVNNFDSNLDSNLK